MSMGAVQPSQNQKDGSSCRPDCSGGIGGVGSSGLEGERGGGYWERCGVPGGVGVSEERGGSGQVCVDSFGERGCGFDGSGCDDQCWSCQEALASSVGPLREFPCAHHLRLCVDDCDSSFRRRSWQVVEVWWLREQGVITLNGGMVNHLIGSLDGCSKVDLRWLVPVQLLDFDLSCAASWSLVFEGYARLRRLGFGLVTRPRASLLFSEVLEFEATDMVRREMKVMARSLELMVCQLEVRGRKCAAAESGCCERKVREDDYFSVVHFGAEKSIATIGLTNNGFAVYFK